MTQNDHDTDIVTKVDTTIAYPSLFELIMHNDHYTTMEFVVEVLVQELGHGVEKAVQLMLQIHEQGSAVVGIYPKDVAEMKVAKVKQLAEQAEYPLLITMHKHL